MEDRTYKDVVVGVLRELGIEHRDSFRYINMRCPFARITHSKGYDRKPSFNFYQTGHGGWWGKCFACGWTGSLRRFIWDIGMMDGWNDKLVRAWNSTFAEREVAGELHLHVTDGDGQGQRTSAGLGNVESAGGVDNREVSIRDMIWGHVVNEVKRDRDRLVMNDYVVGGWRVGRVKRVTGMKEIDVNVEMRKQADEERMRRGVTQGEWGLGSLIGGEGMESLQGVSVGNNGGDELETRLRKALEMYKVGVTFVGEERYGIDWGRVASELGKIGVGRIAGLLRVLKQVEGRIQERLGVGMKEFLEDWMWEQVGKWNIGEAYNGDHVLSVENEGAWLEYLGKFYGLMREVGFNEFECRDDEPPYGKLIDSWRMERILGLARGSLNEGVNGGKEVGLVNYGKSIEALWGGQARIEGFVREFMDIRGYGDVVDDMIGLGMLGQMLPPQNDLSQGERVVFLNYGLFGLLRGYTGRLIYKMYNWTNGQKSDDFAMCQRCGSMFVNKKTMVCSDCGLDFKTKYKHMHGRWRNRGVYGVQLQLGWYRWLENYVGREIDNRTARAYGGSDQQTSAVLDSEDSRQARAAIERAWVVDSMYEGGLYSRKGKVVVVVEGSFDALRIWQMKWRLFEAGMLQELGDYRDGKPVGAYDGIEALRDVMIKNHYEVVPVAVFGADMTLAQLLHIALIKGQGGVVIGAGDNDEAGRRLKWYVVILGLIMGWDIGWLEYEDRYKDLDEWGMDFLSKNTLQP